MFKLIHDQFRMRNVIYIYSPLFYFILEKFKVSFEFAILLWEQIHFLCVSTFEIRRQFFSFLERKHYSFFFWIFCLGTCDKLFNNIFSQYASRNCFRLHIACSEMCQKNCTCDSTFVTVKKRKISKKTNILVFKKISQASFLSARLYFFRIYWKYKDDSLCILSLRSGSHGMLQSREWR